MFNRQTNKYISTNSHQMRIDTLIPLARSRFRAPLPLARPQKNHTRANTTQREQARIKDKHEISITNIYRPANATSRNTLVKPYLRRTENESPVQSTPAFADIRLRGSFHLSYSLSGPIVAADSSWPVLLVKIPKDKTGLHPVGVNVGAGIGDLFVLYC